MLASLELCVGLIVCNLILDLKLNLFWGSVMAEWFRAFDVLPARRFGAVTVVKVVGSNPTQVNNLVKLLNSHTSVYVEC